VKRGERFVRQGRVAGGGAEQLGFWFNSAATDSNSSVNAFGLT